MENTKQNLRLLQDLIFCGHPLYMWEYDRGGKNVYTNCPDEAAPLLRPLLEKEMAGLVPNHQNLYPMVLTNSFGMAWIMDWEYDTAGALICSHIIGPALYDDLSPDAMQTALRVLAENTSRQTVTNVLKTIPVIPITRFFEYGLMLHFCITGEKIHISDLEYASVQESAASESTVSDSHGTWAMEQALLKLVEEGNPDYKEIAGRLVSIGNIGNLGNGNSLRHLKNIVIIFTALCTRAAIRGGLAPEVAYTLSDQYINTIEGCRNLSEIAEINAAMQEDFVQRVHALKKNPLLSSPVQKCCAYVQLHTSEKLSLTQLAEHVGYTVSHLSRKFKQEMGCNISEYILRAKLDRAKDLLLSDDTTIQDICTDLGFSSQSYFGKQFRAYTGFTPSQFRENRGLIK